MDNSYHNEHRHHQSLMPKNLKLEVSWLQHAPTRGTTKALFNSLILKTQKCRDDCLSCDKGIILYDDIDCVCHA